MTTIAQEVARIMDNADNTEARTSSVWLARELMINGAFNGHSQFNWATNT